MMRSITSDDQDFLKQMLYEAIFVPDGKKRPDFDIVDEPDLAAYISEWGRSGDLGLIAEHEGRRVGAVWGRLFNEQNKTYGYIDSEMPVLSMAIAPDYRGKGMGTALLSAFLQEAKEAGFKGVSLSVDPRNPALRMYERAGFEKVGVSGTSWDMVVSF